MCNLKLSGCWCILIILKIGSVWFLFDCTLCWYISLSGTRTRQMHNEIRCLKDRAVSGLSLAEPQGQIDWEISHSKEKNNCCLRQVSSWKTVWKVSVYSIRRKKACAGIHLSSFYHRLLISREFIGWGSWWWGDFSWLWYSFKHRETKGSVAQADARHPTHWLLAKTTASVK